jgi:UDP-GlcNAc:undecaprenyl-phosphate GlcNAc-1-phosphate transferase
VVLVAGALAGALAGFLPYNFNPARVFLGDCGALPVGFMLAAIALKGSIKASAAVAVAVPLLALALPILDAGLAVVRRVVRRKPVFRGDRDHIHHRLVDMGLTPRRAVITLYGVAVLFTAMALAVAMGPQQVVWAALALMLLVIWSGVRALGYWEVTEFQRSFVSRLVAGLRTSGDAALLGAERDIERMDSIDAGWQRVCEVAWELGVTEMHLAPAPGYQDRCPEFYSFAPAPQGPPAPPRDPGPLEARWSVAIHWEGEVVADVTARRPLSRLEFDPGRFAAIVQGLVRRHLTSRRAS